jgi:membrane-bound ClpP family serine protease
MRTAKPVFVPAVQQGRTAEERGPKDGAAFSLGLLSLVASLCTLAVAAGPSRAADEQIGGRFVSVPPTITSEAIKRIHQSIESEYKDFTRAGRPDAKAVREFRIVFDFNPGGRDNRNLDFGLCYNLASEIRSLRQQGMRTIAYVHGAVTGHTVLPVLACELRVLSRNGILGPVLIEGMQPLEKFKKDAYREYGSTTLNEPLISKLFEPDLEIRKSKKHGGFARAKDPDADDNAPPLFKEQDAGVFTQRNYKESSLFEEDLREDREEVARAYGLSREALQERVLSENVVVAVQIPVTGEVNAALEERLDRRLRRALARGANFIVLELRCHGGDTAVANQIATHLIELTKDRDSPLVTVAYVTKDAQDTALYLALGCHYIVMEKNAKLGGFGQLLKGKGPDDLKPIGEGIQDLAKKRSYPAVLARAFVDSSVNSLFYVTRRDKNHEWDIVTGRDLDEDRGHNAKERRWNPIGGGDAIPLGPDRFLTLDAAQARRFGLAHPRADDLDSLYEDFGVERSRVQVLGADWLDDLAEFLTKPWTSFLLIMIGITCLFLELKVPGVGLPGVIAALCFVLYFWSNAQWFGHQVTWLAILLFVLGLVLMGIEIFVLPGFGVCGISGIILVIGSLALVAVGHWPQTGQEWVGLSKKVGPLGLGLMGAVVLFALVARYLPNIPYASRLLLKPRTETDDLDEAGEAVMSAYAALLGAIGVATTPLRPAGKVQFGEQFVDVVAEGSYILPGTRVQVIEIEGNRVVVKQV